jgi:hypothetical protein
MIGNKFICIRNWLHRMEIIHNLLVNKFNSKKYEEYLNLYVYKDGDGISLKTNKPLNHSELCENADYHINIAQDRNIIEDFIYEYYVSDSNRKNIIRAGCFK